MLQFANATPTGSSGSLVYQYLNNTQSQMDIVLLTSFNGEQCNGPLGFFNESSTSLPLVDCSDENQVQDAVGIQVNCLFVYSSQGAGCQLLANSTIDAPNVFAFLDLGMSEILEHNMDVNVIKISIDKPNGDLFRNALVGIVVSLSVILCIAVSLVWWKLSRRMRSQDTRQLGANPHTKSKIEPDELDLFETLRWKPDSPHTECSVCLEEYQNNQLLRRLWCDHIFHKQCVDRWLKTHRFCPLCRSEFKNEE